MFRKAVQTIGPGCLKILRLAEKLQATHMTPHQHELASIDDEPNPNSEVDSFTVGPGYLVLHGMKINLCYPASL
jgi:hypothetical protein